MIAVPPADWTPPDALRGRMARLERLRPDHAPLLWPALDGHPEVWRWLFEGPFDRAEDHAALIARQAESPDPAFYAVHDGAAWTGVASLMRINRGNGTIEIGNVCLSPALQRTTAATDALAAMARAAFDAGFRRLEWKCNALNAPSRRAARRLGYAYEGTFRQHMVVKGLSRDTAWYAILDREWPAIRAVLDAWLEGAAAGAQPFRLSARMAAAAAELDRPPVDDPAG